MSIIVLTGCGNDYKWDTDNTSPLEGKYETRNVSLDLTREEKVLALKSKTQNFFYSNYVPGLSLSVIFDDNSTFNVAYGCAKLRDDVEKSAILNYESGPNANCEEKLLPTHRFKIGSLTKTTVARTILDIDDNAEFDFDINDPITKHLPKRILDMGNLSGITVKNLLHHTSGLPNVDYKPRTAEDMIRVLLKKKKLFKPGQTYRYTNSNFVFLGQIIEHVTGSKYWQVEVNKRIAESIGKDNSFIFPEPQNPNWLETRATAWLINKENTLLEGNSSLVIGYDHNKTASTFISLRKTSGADIADAAGSAIASTIDISKWFKGVATNDSHLLTDKYFLENIERINTDTYEDIYIGNPTWNTGSGLFFEQAENVLWHLGNFNGYACSAIYSKNEKVTISACINQSGNLSKLNFDLLSSIYPYRKEFLPKKTSTSH